MPFEVINLADDASHGVFPTLEEARGCARFDRLSAYSIWSGSYQAGEFVSTVRVEHCEPYDGDDDRARQGLGQ